MRSQLSQEYEPIECDYECNKRQFGPKYNSRLNLQTNTNSQKNQTTFTKINGPSLFDLDFADDDEDVFISNQIERKIGHDTIVETVPVIFAFAVTAKRHETFDEELLPPKMSVQASKINWRSSYDGSRVIHIACAYGKTNFVRQLLDVGVELSVQNSEGNTPLLSAIKAGRTKVAVMLLKRMTQEEINHRNLKGESALFCAIQKENIVLIEYLIKHECDINLQNMCGTSPLMLAMQKNNPEIIGMLLENNADKTLVDKNEQNCLHYYARSDHFNNKSIPLLIEICKDPSLINKEDTFGNIPLHYSIKSGNDEIMNHLLALSSAKDVGVVYDEVDDVCKTLRGRDNIIGKNKKQFFVKTDSLGFMLEEDQFYEEDKEMNSEKRLKKWKEMIDIIRQKGNHPKLFTRLLKGVPTAIRKELWCAIMGIYDLKSENGNEFQQIKASQNQLKDPKTLSSRDYIVDDDENENGSSDLTQSITWSQSGSDISYQKRKKDDDQIHKDVQRAHQTNVNFALKYSEGQKQLFYSLKYYSLFDKEVGYVQGMADLFGLFVLVLNDIEDVFWSIHQTFLLPKYQLRESFFQGFVGVIKFEKLETLMLKTYHKDIYAKVMKSGGIQILLPHLLEYYALWFCRVFPGEIAVWLLDLIVAEGWHMSLSIASTIFHFLKDKIMEADDDIMCIDILLKKPFQLIKDFDKFIFVKQLKKMKIPSSQVDKWLLECN